MTRGAVVLISYDHGNSPGQGTGVGSPPSQDLLNQGLNPGLLHLTDPLPSESLGKPICLNYEATNLQWMSLNPKGKLILI